MFFLESINFHGLLIFGSMAVLRLSVRYKCCNKILVREIKVTENLKAKGSLSRKSVSFGHVLINKEIEFLRSRSKFIKLKSRVKVSDRCQLFEFLRLS